MADDMTASRAQGFGSTEQKTDNSDQIAELLDQVRDLMVEDGADPATAEALTNFARPNRVVLAGNLADLMRMGQIAHQGEIETPPGEPNIEAATLEEAFTTIVPPPPDLNQGVIVPTPAPAAEEAVAEESGYETWTKADLTAALDEAGIAYTSAETKADLIVKLEGA